MEGFLLWRFVLLRRLLISALKRCLFLVSRVRRCVLIMVFRRLLCLGGFKKRPVQVVVVRVLTYAKLMPHQMIRVSSLSVFGT